jgi:TRAP-type C4-dicarboxylate transport system substrate-binding protein
VSSNVAVCAIGGTVFRKKALDDLPADLKQVFFDLQERMDKGNSHRVRKMDDESYARISKKMELVTLTDADKKEWEKVLRQVVDRLAQGTFDRALIDRVVKLSGK